MRQILAILVVIMGVLPLPWLSSHGHAGLRILGGSVQEESLDTPDLQPLDTAPQPPPKVYALPPLPLEDETLASQETLFVREIVVEGGTILSEEEIRKTLAPYLDREVAMAELLTLRDRLTMLYVSRGYATSGAMLSDQPVTGGRIRFHLVEGELTEVRVHGVGWLNLSHVADRLKRAAGKPVNVHDLETELQILRQKEMIRNIRADLSPGVNLGEAIMEVTLEEAPPFQVGASYHNQGSPSIGSRQQEGEVILKSVLGFQDRLRWTKTKSEGVRHFSLSYHLPVNDRDTTLHVAMERSDSSVVAPPFAALNITSASRSWEIGGRHPLFRDANNEFAASIAFQQRQSATFLEGVPFSFTEGSDEGEIIVSVFNLGQEWIHRDQREVLAVSATLSKGLNCCHATRLDTDEVDGRFIAWQGQVQWVRRLPVLESQVRVRSVLRLTSDAMLASEKFPIGGAHTVRGYQENHTSRDQGMLLSAEWWVPTPLSLPIPGLSAASREEDGRFSLVPFFDYGKNWEKDDNGNPAEPDDLSSIGLGLSWRINPVSSAEIFAARRLRKVPLPDDPDWQDRGIHFNVSLANF